MGNRQFLRYLKYALIVLGVVLVILFVFLVVNYRSLRRAQLISFHQFWIASVVKNHSPLTASDVGVIRSWMTFDYVNKIFNLPPGYLETKLMISDPHYPGLSLGGYARSRMLDPNAFVNAVEDAIRSYMTAAQAAPAAQ